LPTRSLLGVVASGALAVLFTRGEIEEKNIERRRRTRKNDWKDVRYGTFCQATTISAL